MQPLLIIILRILGFIGLSYLLTKSNEQSIALGIIFFIFYSKLDFLEQK